MKENGMFSGSKTITKIFVVALSALAMLSVLLQRAMMADESKPTWSLRSITSAFGGLDYTLPFPVYYINTDSSKERRKRTELLFWGPLGFATKSSRGRK